MIAWKMPIKREAQMRGYLFMLLVTKIIIFVLIFLWCVYHYIPKVKQRKVKLNEKNLNQKSRNTTYMQRYWGIRKYAFDNYDE